MIVESALDMRRVIPRWRESKIALATGELAFAGAKKKPRQNPSTEQLQDKLRLWRENPNIELAADVVASGFSQGDYLDVVDAAEYLLAHGQDATPAVLSIALELLVRSGVNKQVNHTGVSGSAVERNTLFAKVHDLRNSLSDYPHNAIMWVDLARAYVVLGQFSKASEAMRVALCLAPDNRFVLRSAARLYIHLDEPDRAHDLLLRREITRTDPWLLAAEIATGMVANATPKFIKGSRDILDRGAFEPFHTSELASALGSLELSKGSFKNARKLFQASLVEPTENSVAQSAWAKLQLPTLDISSAITSTRRTYEAKAWEAFLALHWQEIMAASRDWFLDEPYSSRPAELGSYAASVGLDDYLYAERITSEALLSNPGDAGLINNHAFALANQGKLLEATKVLTSVPRPASRLGTEVALRATEGLISFRSGNVAVGQNQYLDAIAFAASKGLRKMATLATIYFVRELIRTRTIPLPEAIALAEKAAGPSPEPDVKWLLDKAKKEAWQPPQK